MVGQDTVPDFPTPIALDDRRRRPRWTVSIPQDGDFPLSIGEYAAMGARCRDVSAHVRRLHRPPLTDHNMLAHDEPDAYFVDVDKAERVGLLSTGPKNSHPRHSGHFVGLNWESMAGKPMCKSSLTFVMESSDAGLGTSFMTLWTLYALAKAQGRGFFVDDSRWAYGAYTDVFQPPPLPDCRPLHRHHMLPCPAQARHLVVSAVTAKHVLPLLLARHGRITGKAATQRDLYELARTGHQHLFALVKEDHDYVRERVQELEDKAGKKGDKSSAAAPIIGLHIRRGDRHPFEYQYRDNYIPTDVFAGHAQRLAESHYNHTGIREPRPKAVTLIASDDPAVHGEEDLSGALPAQQRIRLASKGAVQNTAPDPRVLHRFVEEAQGWDGGFFALMFWNLGDERKKTAAATSVPGDGAEPAKAPSQETLRLRAFIGRAYMMDLAVLAAASDSVVCAVSATGCRLLGVMMGWERVMEKGAWVNVDGGFGWSGLGW